MKPTIQLLFATAVFLTLTACVAPDDSPPQVFDAPPRLTISTNNIKFTALSPSANWSYEQADGTMQNTVICGDTPLNMQEDLPSFPLHLTDVTAALDFETPPDTIRAVCWSAEHGKDPEAPSIPVFLEDGELLLRRGAYIYEIHAEWTQAEKYGGEASYSFYTTLSKDELVADPLT